MKYIIILFFIVPIAAKAQIENLIIITTDGLRWQEVFKGVDTAIANNPKFNQSDCTLIYNKYWANTQTESRKKLMPFLWTTIKNQGQIYGNRNYNNNVNVANPYWFSYPGYSEIFCGMVDTAINSNAYTFNPNTNVLAFLNTQPNYKNKVAAFGAWFAFDKIFNKPKNNFPLYCGQTLYGQAKKTDATEQLLNTMMLNAYQPFGTEEPLDIFTHYAAMHYLQKNKPKILYIAYGETDEWAHSGQYRDYLNAANQVDKWLSDLWLYLQAIPQYKNKTALFITTDHGRGDANKAQWTSHNAKIAGANEIWFAAIGPSINAAGEIKTPMQIYQKQFAQTFANLLNTNFICTHAVATGVATLLNK